MEKMHLKRWETEMDMNPKVTDVERNLLNKIVPMGAQTYRNQNVWTWEN